MMRTAVISLLLFCFLFFLSNAAGSATLRVGSAVCVRKREREREREREGKEKKKKRNAVHCTLLVK